MLFDIVGQWIWYGEGRLAMQLLYRWVVDGNLMFPKRLFILTNTMIFMQSCYCSMVPLLWYLWS